MLPLLVFLLYWVGMLWIASIAMREGDLARLEAGMDYDNRLCGVDRPGSETGGSVDLKRLPYVYFACLVYGQRHPTVCVDECPPLSGHYVRWYNGSNINCKTPRGISIPATTYPTTTMGGKCVPSAASLYALVAGDIDDSAFLSVLAGVYKTLRWTLAACGAAAVLAACWLCAVRALCKRGRLAPVTIGCAIGSLLALALTLLLRAYYLGSAAFAEDMPALQGSLEVAVNTDMSVGLAILVFFLALTVTVALWCGLLQRLLQAGGILAEAAEAAASKPSLVVLLPLLLMAGLALLFGHGRTVRKGRALAAPQLAAATDSAAGRIWRRGAALPTREQGAKSAPQMPLTGRGPGATPRQSSPKLTKAHRPPRSAAGPSPRLSQVLSVRLAAARERRHARPRHHALRPSAAAVLCVHDGRLPVDSRDVAPPGLLHGLGHRRPLVLCVDRAPCDGRGHRRVVGGGEAPRRAARHGA